MGPCVVNISCYLGDLQIRKSTDPLHRLVELFAIYHKLTAFPEADQTNHFFKIILHEVGGVERRINPAQATAIDLMTVAAVFEIKLFTPDVVLVKLRR